MTTWIAVVLVGLGSYALRYAPIVALDRVRLPAVVERALSHAGAAAMTALIASALMQHLRSHQTVVDVGALVAVAVAALVATTKRSFGVVVATGLVVYGLALVVANLI
jgi:branched-subunit amino acid transport protein